MWKLLIASVFAAGIGGLASAQDERRCCHITEGVWLDGTYTPAECRARGEDFAPQGDGRAMMCTRGESTEIPPAPPGAPGSPGGGPGGGGGGDGSGAGDGSGDGGRGGAVRPARNETSQGVVPMITGGMIPVRCERDEDTYCIVRIYNLELDYDEVTEAPAEELESLLGTIEQQSQACTQLEDETVEMQCMAETGQMCLPRCYSNLRSNSHLITQNAGRMRNDRTLDAAAREQAVSIFETARALREHADAWLGTHREERRN